MKEKINKLRSSMESTGRDHTEIVAALERLDEQIGDGDVKTLINDEIENTATELDKQELLEGHISGRWKTLGERLEDWEKDHPGIALTIGDIARALSVYGL